MYCWKCGKENRDSAAFCRYCGSPQTIHNSSANITQPTEENAAEHTNNVEEQIQSSYTLPFNYAKLCPKCNGAMFSTEIPRTKICVGLGGRIMFYICWFFILCYIAFIFSPAFGVYFVYPSLLSSISIIYVLYQLYKHRSKTVLRCERCGYEEKE